MPCATHLKLIIVVKASLTPRYLGHQKSISARGTKDQRTPKGLVLAHNRRDFCNYDGKIREGSHYYAHRQRQDISYIIS